MGEAIAFTSEMATVLAILGLAIVLFVTEVVRVDVAAVVILVILGLGEVVPSAHLFEGFASNAVISIIAVMIIGAGLDRTGIMGVLAGRILIVGGNSERGIIPIVSGTVALISSFMQNIGAAALFLPVVSRISARTGIPLSRLLMPMGFCAILGGTMTMIGSSPLILLNDLIIQSNERLPQGVPEMQTYELFAVTPIGIALVLTGILYFVIAGRFILPEVLANAQDPSSTAEYYEKQYGIRGEVFEARVPPNSQLAGMTVAEAEAIEGTPFIIAVRANNQVTFQPPIDAEIPAGCEFALMGPEAQIQSFRAAMGLELKSGLKSFVEVLSPTRAGIAEIVIPPGSTLIGRSIRDIQMRKRYHLQVLSIYREEQVLQRSDIRFLPLRAGDTMVVHTRWDDLASLAKDRNFVIVTDFPREVTRPNKLLPALGFLVLALGLTIFTDIKLSLALMTGAVGMILSGVLSIDEAYAAVGWQTVFLLASLLPLGVAVETTGTAAWLAQQTLSLLGPVPAWGLQAALAVLATLFTLVMSNVGATVLLVPIAVNIAIGAGADPALFALTVAIATSNSFLIPTHQVNALIMGPAGYRVRDFMRAGGVMTMLFLGVSLSVLNLLY